MKDKSLKLRCGDFFHVEVVETDETEVEDSTSTFMSGIKLEIKDGPAKNHYMYFDLRLNPHLKAK